MIDKVTRLKFPDNDFVLKSYNNSLSPNSSQYINISLLTKIELVIDL